MKNTTRLTPKSLSELALHLKKHTPSFFSSARTSTVIAYEKLEADGEQFSALMGPETTWVDVSLLPGSIELRGEEVVVSGHISWGQLRSELNAKGRDIMTSPTESLAGILAGLATSATGERSFGYGTLRDQVIALKYMDYNGEIQELKAARAFPEVPGLAAYQASYEPYHHFKNAPFPRALKETDLLIGTEGQLGVITEVTLKTIALEPLTYLFFKLPRWDQNFSDHLKIFNVVKDYRHLIGACELIDSHSLSYLPPEQNPAPGFDLIFLELKTRDFDALFEELQAKLPELDFEQVFAMDESKCRALRVAVPRAIFEANTRAGVTKKGTDVQVPPAQFGSLLELYAKWAHEDIEFNLFGHFGDAHLHFNFMPTPERASECDQKLSELYLEVKRLGGSPFAEHGIGLLKQRYIKNFYQDVQQNFFRALKDRYDPYRQFFPTGFMSHHE